MTPRRNTRTPSAVEVDLAPVMAASRLITAAVVQSLSAVNRSVTVPQLRVLVMLATHGRLHLTAVATGLGVNASNASRTCDQLVAAGLVDKQVDPHDRRRASLALTQRGRSLVADVMAHRERLLAAVVAEMPPAGQRRLVAALQEFTLAATAMAAEDAPAGLEGDLAIWAT
ncbi:MAG: MarR family transcriptional regulator [Nocardioidaceae bacterium]|nr:MarR family transcriptional regulator [Nocardioidaceae bacterium]